MTLPPTLNQSAYYVDTAIVPTVPEASTMGQLTDAQAIDALDSIINNPHNRGASSVGVGIGFLERLYGMLAERDALIFALEHPV